MRKFSKSCEYFLGELTKKRYITYTVNNLLNSIDKPLDKTKVHVAVRLDVDSDLELCEPLSEKLAANKLNATFYFLTHPERYYEIWNSSIPSLIHKNGFEVGIHSDHYYEELVFGTNALKKIKEDIVRLSDIAGVKIKGITAHGHPAIDRTDKRNWDVYNHLDPQELGLAYHDGVLAKVQKSHSVIDILDHLKIPNGWRYWPRYPQCALRRIAPGSVVMFIIHPDTFFHFRSLLRITSLKDFFQHIYLFLRLRLRHQVVGALIGEGKSARKELKKLVKPGGFDKRV